MAYLFWNLFQFGILPALMAAACLRRRRLLWIVPFLSVVVFMLISWIREPCLFEETEWWGQTLVIGGTLQFFAATVVTLVIFWLDEDREIVRGFAPETLFGAVAVLALCFNMVGFLNGKAASGTNVAVTAVYLLAWLALALFGGRRRRAFLAAWGALTLVTGAAAWSGILLDWPIPGLSYLMMLLFETPFFGLRAFTHRNFELMHAIVACVGLLGLLSGLAGRGGPLRRNKKNGDDLG